MTAALDGDVRGELRAIVRQLIADQSPVDAVCRVANDSAGFAPRMWTAVAELGITGLEVEETYGGVGMTFRELAGVLEELGRGVVPLPVISSVVLGTAVVRVLGSPAQRDEWLPSLVDGTARFAVALGPDPANVRVESGRLSGQVRCVLDAHAADIIVVAADDSLYLVPLADRDVRLRPAPTYDQTRRLADVDLDGAEGELIGPPGAAPAVLDWLLDRAAAALAADSSGGARRVMEIAVEYAKERVQFDRPVGSFQAVKHMCADMLVAVESAAAATQAAARALPLAPGSPCHWAAIAKSYAADAYAQVAGLAIRVHGGVGFTWEHPLHLYLKRAQLNQALFGTTALHRERFARSVLD